ncbi:hypothetical protein Rs2_44341 [Raphanus sativus]|nr:hypothetical protein Rs2_44341 [Raphanus sativus]
MDQHFDPINNCVSREFKEGVDREKLCYVLVQSVKTENNTTREPYLAIFTDSGSRVIIIYGKVMEKITMKVANHRREVNLSKKKHCIRKRRHIRRTFLMLWEETLDQLMYWRM